MAGEPAPANAPPQAAPPAPVPAPPAPATDTGMPASQFGFQANGDFVAMLGGPLGFRILDADIKATGRKGIDFSKRPQPIPGLKIEKVYVANEKATLQAALAIPAVADGDFKIKVDKAGTATFEGEVQKTIAIPALGNPTLKAAINEQGQITGSATVEGADLLPKSFKKASATGSGTINVAAGQMTGEGKIDLAYPDLGAASISFKFGEASTFSASGSFTMTPPFLSAIKGEFSVDEAKNLVATASIDIASHTSPIPALTLSAGKIDIGYINGKPSATLSAFAADYKGFGSVAITTAALDRGGKFSGAGTFKLIVPALKEASGTVALNDGKVSGSLTVSADKFPKGVPVTGGSITAKLSEQGKLAFSGSVEATFGKIGSGKVEASYSETGQLNLGVVADITVPGLQPVHVVLAYKEGLIEGEVGVPINSDLIPGLTGNVTVRYKDAMWSGETNLAYSADDGKLSGNVLVTVAQKEDKTLALGGSGKVRAQIMPRLAGTLTATILPEGGVDVSGAIEVTEPLELFPEKRIDKELFKYSQNIPLWAILVAIIRVRAGVRAGIGPGVFRNIKVEGSYTFGSEKTDPSFTISGEMFIPAFVEGYVAFGAGLGLDVLLGSLTGGIEAVATAGIYGAISVVPELTYEGGDWGIEGTATMAAGARLKVGLNAWAEVEALWITVWENTWKLAEHVVPIGPDLGLKAHMSYKFGQPNPPEVEMTTSDIDTDALVQGAMPKDGPAPSGAREALENKAQWKGALKEQRKAPVPPETAAQAKKTEAPPAAPAKPGKKPGPPAGGAKATGEGANKDPGAAPTPGNEPARSAAVDDAAKKDTSKQGAVPESAIPNAKTVRYPSPITLEMLNEPPAPMPRTKDQEQEDINAAKTAIDLAGAAASDTNALDEYFPRIKARFGLASLGYVGDFGKGFEIVGQINPSLKVKTHEPLNSTGLPSDIAKKHISKVGFGVTQLDGQRVGIQMTAFPLGPEHDQGTPPGGDLESFMKQLPGGTTGDTDLRFIQGHLLNDNLGGPGQDKNLFPITASANAQHSNLIEKTVRNWVNDRKFWVKYTVDIVSDGVLRAAAGGKKKVDSTIKVKAAVLDMQLDEVDSLRTETTIQSKFSGGKDNDTSTQTFTDADVDAHEANEVRPADLKIKPQLSTRNEDQVYMFPDDIKAAMKASRDAGNSYDQIRDAVQGYVGFGPGKADLLVKTYQMVNRGKDNTLEGLNANEKALFTQLVNGWGASISRAISKNMNG